MIQFSRKSWSALYSFSEGKVQFEYGCTYFCVFCFNVSSTKRLGVTKTLDIGHADKPQINSVGSDCRLLYPFGW